MKNIFSFLILVFILLYTVGANRYIDFAAVAGGTGADSTLSGGTGAWKNPSEITGLGAGDTLFWRRGSKWREPAGSPLDTKDSVKTFTQKATPESPIVWMAYGEGEKPIISGAKNPSIDGGMKWALSGTQANVYYLTTAADSTADPGYNKFNRLFLADGAVVELVHGKLDSLPLADLEWDWGNWDGLGFETAYMRNDAGVPSLNVEIPQFSGASGLVNLMGVKDWKIEDLIVEFTNTNALGIIKAQGFYCLSGSTVTYTRCEARYICNTGFKLDTVDFVIIDSCQSYANTSDGIGVGGGKSDPLQNGIVIRNCIVRDNRRPIWKCPGWGFCGAVDDTLGFYGNGSGMKVFMTNGMIIENNLVYNNDTGGIRLDGDSVGCDYPIVRGNITHGNGFSTLQGAGGIFLEYTRGALVTQNLSYNNIDHQIAVSINNYREDLDDSAQGYDTLCYNVTRNSVPVIQDSGIRLGWGSKNTYVFNNTIDSCYYGIMFNEDTTGLNNWTVKNNIVTNSSHADLWFWNAGAESSLISCDFNNFSGGGVENVVKMLGGPNLSLAQWQARDGGHDANSISSDPLYVDVDNDNFNLTKASPSINAGTELPRKFNDYNDNVVRFLPDQGAFESGSPLLYQFFRVISRNQRTNPDRLSP